MFVIIIVYYHKTEIAYKVSWNSLLPFGHVPASHSFIILGEKETKNASRNAREDRKGINVNALPLFSFLGAT